MLSKVSSSNPNFGWLNIDTESKAIVKRLNGNYEDLDRIKALVFANSSNPIEVEILPEFIDSTRKLRAIFTVTDKMQNMGYKGGNVKEGFFEQYTSPVNFIERMANKATKMYNEYQAASKFKEALEGINKKNIKRI